MDPWHDNLSRDVDVPAGEPRAAAGRSGNGTANTRRQR
jgi:hypothetical protein